MPDLAGLISKEYAFFANEEQCVAFAHSAIAPERVMQSWGYGSETHECYVVARTSTEQIVFCATGFGPDFPWSLQLHGTTDLGMDSLWSAYLFECVVGTEIWPDVPVDFMLMGPGEREPVRADLAQ